MSRVVENGKVAESIELAAMCGRLRFFEALSDGSIADSPAAANCDRGERGRQEVAAFEGQIEVGSIETKRQSPLMTTNVTGGQIAVRASADEGHSPAAQSSGALEPQIVAPDDRFAGGLQLFE